MLDGDINKRRSTFYVSLPDEESTETEECSSTPSSKPLKKIQALVGLFRSPSGSTLASETQTKGTDRCTSDKRTCAHHVHYDKKILTQNEKQEICFNKTICNSDPLEHSDRFTKNQQVVINENSIPLNHDNNSDGVTHLRLSTDRKIKSSETSDRHRQLNKENRYSIEENNSFLIKNNKCLTLPNNLSPKMCLDFGKGKCKQREIVLSPQEPPKSKIVAGFNFIRRTNSTKLIRSPSLLKTLTAKCVDHGDEAKEALHKQYKDKKRRYIDDEDQGVHSGISFFFHR